MLEGCSRSLTEIFYQVILFRDWKKPTQNKTKAFSDNIKFSWAAYNWARTKTFHSSIFISNSKVILEDISILFLKFLTVFCRYMGKGSYPMPLKNVKISKSKLKLRMEKMNIETPPFFFLDRSQHTTQRTLIKSNQESSKCSDDPGNKIENI